MISITIRTPFQRLCLSRHSGVHGSGNSYGTNTDPIIGDITVQSRWNEFHLNFNSDGEGLRKGPLFLRYG